ncbi:FUSC family protein [Kitasatospora purpeofusca]|uniref:FUSC family protein n=1 Tax=Kitasatospora purpeofusca TaxID=67352 RepID=UPI002256C483|nr:FUSC family protein [Kitasatospora purpeofusca]MCX4756273.1 FUSC family protein [Kitasatospora purpeofusca]WSR35898.1 FUSC family protein [Kitasatospora purpeofusca]WSR44208.1 FUSC family protein [Kitasatospora purpeofusca]
MAQSEHGVRLSPPTWLTAGLRPRPAPVPWAAVARASVALSAPLAVGLAAGRPAYGALVSMGALSGVIGDTADAYRMRFFNIAVPQLFGAVGVTLGTLVYGRDWTAVVVLTLVALVSGMISSIGSVASVSGLLLLLNAVVGAGLPMPRPWWTAPLLLTAGGAVVLLLTLFGWPLRGGVPERAAVAASYRSVAAFVRAAGTPEHDERRQDVTQSLNASYDLLLAHRTRRHGRSPGLTRLIARLNALIPIVEAASAAKLRPARLGPLPEAWPAAVLALADGIEDDRPRSGSAVAPEALDLPEPTGPSERALDRALRYAAAVGAEPDHAHAADPDRLGRPAAPWVRTRRATRAALLSGASWRYGLRLALCIGLAQVVVSVLPVPRSYWVALTVTFVLKPDFGSVFSRAVLRALGTAGGLLLAVPVLAEVPRGWWDVPTVAVLAALIPAFSAKGYAFQTAAITPVILLLSDLLNHQGFGLVLPRLYDSLIGCGIALVAGYLCWPESWHTRIGDRLADAVADASAYVALAFAGAPGHDRPARPVRRRRLYRDLSAVRSEFQRALTEPPPTGPRAAAWWPLVIAVERVVEATTATRVRVEHGEPAPPPGEVAAIAADLAALAGALRTGTPLPRPDGDATAGAGGATAAPDVLGPLRSEVRAACAIASPVLG